MILHVEGGAYDNFFYKISCSIISLSSCSSMNSSLKLSPSLLPEKKNSMPTGTKLEHEFDIRHQ